MEYNVTELILGDKLKLKPYAEHLDRFYYVYFDNIPPDILKYKFHARWRMEEFLYRSGIDEFDYKSSNGNIIHKVWKIIPEKLDKWKYIHSSKRNQLPEKYSWDDYMCGHFIKGE